MSNRRAAASTTRMRYAGSDGYFTIIDSEHVLMHPIYPEIQGRDVRGFKDPNGVLTFQVAIDIVNREGKGFTRIGFSKPGVSGVFPKITYEDTYRP